jgi:DNA-binding beta-propeller fold protein YncE
MPWYVSFHGGDDPQDRNNIHAYDEAGAHVGKMLDGDDLPDGMRLRELRGFAFGPDGDLYVANAWKGQSQILRFAGTPGAKGRHAFREVFSAGERSDAALAHPFDVAFGPDGHLFVPNQDSDIVARYFGPAASDGQPGSPMPHPPAVAGIGKPVPPGTFVPSAKHADHGLKAVRHAIFGHDGHLYVADRDRDAVNCYDRETGALLQTFRHDRLAAPVHLLPWPERNALLVGSRDRGTVISLDLASGEARDLLDGDSGLKAPSGLAWGPDGLLYVADRTGRAILRYAPDDGARRGIFLEGLGDQPEFIAWVDADPPRKR